MAMFVLGVVVTVVVFVIFVGIMMNIEESSPNYGKIPKDLEKELLQILDKIGNNLDSIKEFSKYRLKTDFIEFSEMNDVWYLEEVKLSKKVCNKIDSTVDKAKIKKENDKIQLRITNARSKIDEFKSKEGGLSLLELEDV